MYSTILILLLLQGLGIQSLPYAIPAFSVSKCENEILVIQCPYGYEIKILDVFYGRALDNTQFQECGYGEIGDDNYQPCSAPFARGIVEGG